MMTLTMKQSTLTAPQTLLTSLQRSTERTESREHIVSPESTEPRRLRQVARVEQAFFFSLALGYLGLVGGFLYLLGTL